LLGTVGVLLGTIRVVLAVAPLVVVLQVLVLAVVRKGGKDRRNSRSGVGEISLTLMMAEAI
jgi:hypothetical protein